MDGRLLGANAARLPMDFRLLGGRQRAGNNLSASAARDLGSGTESCRTFAGLRLDAGLLDLVSRALCLATGLLGAKPGGLELVPGLLCLDTAGTHFRGRLLGLPGGAARNTLCAGLF